MNAKPPLPDLNISDAVGKIGNLQGDVFIIRSTGETIIAQEENPVYMGDVVMTANNSNAVVFSKDGALIELASTSEIKLTLELLQDIYDERKQEELNPLSEKISDVANSGIGDKNLEKLLNAPSVSLGEPDNTIINSSSTINYEPIIWQRSAQQLLPNSEFNDDDNQVVENLFNRVREDTSSINDINSNTLLFSDTNTLQPLSTSSNSNNNVLVLDSLNNSISRNAAPTNFILINNSSALEEEVIADSNNNSNASQLVNILVDPIVNLTANDDALTVEEDSGVTRATVANNDITSSGGILRYELVEGSDVSSGRLVFSEDGSYTYEPNANFNGSDSFAYRVIDTVSGESATQTVTISVVPDNEILAVAPVIVNNEGLIPESTGLLTQLYTNLDFPIIRTENSTNAALLETTFINGLTPTAVTRSLEGFSD